MRVRVGELIFVAALGIHTPCSAQLAPDFSRETQPSTHPSISLSISARQSEVKVGSNVVVDVIRTNISSEILKESSFVSGNLTYPVQVLNSEGKPAPLTSFGQKRYREGWGGLGNGLAHVSYSLNPGETRKTWLLVNKTYDLSQPGNYTMQVQTRDRSGGTVKSNIIAIIVTP